MLNYGISKKWDLRPGTFGRTQDPSPGINLIGGTRDLKGVTRHPGPGTHLIGWTRDQRSGTLKVAPKTWGSGPISWMGTKTHDPKGENQDP